jgi:hypothetical protein
MGLKDCSKSLSKLATSAKLVFEWGEGSTSKSNVIKTQDLRCDVHRNLSHPGLAVARIQVNKDAKDPGAKEFLRKGNKGSGHKTTHKNLAEIPFSQTNFDETEFQKQIADAWRASGANDDNVGEGSGSGSGGSSSSEWIWWNDEGIWHRQINGVDEWLAPESDADSDWIYSTRQRKYFIKYANGAVVWQ